MAVRRSPPLGFRAISCTDGEDGAPGAAGPRKPGRGLCLVLSPQVLRPICARGYYSLLRRPLSRSDIAAGAAEVPCASGEIRAYRGRIRRPTFVDPAEQSTGQSTGQPAEQPTKEIYRLEVPPCSTRPPPPSPFLRSVLVPGRAVDGAQPLSREEGRPSFLGALFGCLFCG